MNDPTPDWVAALVPLLLFICGYAVGYGDHVTDWRERAEGLWRELWEDAE